MKALTRRRKQSRRVLDTLFHISALPRIAKGGCKSLWRIRLYQFSYDSLTIFAKEWECTSDTSSESENWNG